MKECAICGEPATGYVRVTVSLGIHGEEESSSPRCADNGCHLGRRYTTAVGNNPPARTV